MVAVDRHQLVKMARWADHDEMSLGTRDTPEEAGQLAYEYRKIIVRLGLQKTHGVYVRQLRLRGRHNGFAPTWGVFVGKHNRPKTPERW